MSTAQVLADIGRVVDDMSIGAILLGELPSAWSSPSSLALEESGNVRIVKQKLLNERRIVSGFEEENWEAA